jgi:hypothetical protein
MIRPFLIVCITVVFGMSAAASAPANEPLNVPPPSSTLVAALLALRQSPPPDPVAWATQLPNLAPPDRDALVYWLSAHGRAALHAQGATDAQIGIPIYAIDYALVPAPFPASVVPLPAAPVPTPPPAPAPRRRSFWGLLAAAALPTIVAPIAHSSSSSSSTSPDGSETTTQSSSTSVSVGVDTGALVSSLIDASTAHGSSQSPSSAWRQLPFGAMSVSAASPSQITVTHGIASVRYDGTQGFACLSLVNNAPQPATEVDVDIQIVDGYGFLKRVLPLRRVATFTPGVAVEAPTSLRDVRAPRPGCVMDGEGDAADATDPFAAAAVIGYTVREVKYADGTAWLEPGANAWGP